MYSFQWLLLCVLLIIFLQQVVEPHVQFSMAASLCVTYHILTTGRRTTCTVRIVADNKFFVSVGGGSESNVRRLRLFV